MKKIDKKEIQHKSTAAAGQKAVGKDKKIDTGKTGSNARRDRNLEKSGSGEA